MADVKSTQSVAEALEGVNKWFGEEQARHKAELAEVDQEMESLRTAMANLQQQLDALTKFREELTGKLETIELGVHQKNYEALFAALQAQASKLGERAAQVGAEQKKRDEALEEKLSDGGVKKLLAEYESFKTQVEPTLVSLPESYRVVVRQHHDGVRAQLQAELEKLGTGPIEVEGDKVNVEVVVAVDAQEGAPGVIMLVLPVTEAVQTAWATRAEDLQSWVAIRTMQAVYQVCQSLGLPAVQAMYGGHAGLLAVEAEIGAGRGQEVADRVVAELEKVSAAAAELGGAKVSLTGRKVDVDYLFPPEEDEVAASGPAEPAASQEVSNA